MEGMWYPYSLLWFNQRFVCLWLGIFQILQVLALNADQLSAKSPYGQAFYFTFNISMEYSKCCAWQLCASLWMHVTTGLTEKRFATGQPTRTSCQSLYMTCHSYPIICTSNSERERGRERDHFAVMYMKTLDTKAETECVSEREGKRET